MSRRLRPTERAARLFDSGIPACWTWPLPSVPEEIGALRKEFPAMSDEDARWAAKTDWQDSRCAICGMPSTQRRLLNDHDHQTGMYRGGLCTSCNTREALCDEPIFVRYRLVNPATVYGLEIDMGADPLVPQGGDDLMRTAIDAAFGYTAQVAKAS